jgi:type II secretory pathway pseudopilin PulG
MLTRLRAARRDDAGYSLIELLAVMFMVGIIGTVVGMAIILGLRSTRQQQNRSTVVSQVQTALDRMERDLRTADPLQTATATSISMTVNRLAGCLVKTYSLNTGTGTLTEAQSNCSGGTSTTRTLVTGLTNNATSNPLFTYYGATCPATGVAAGSVSTLAPPIGDLTEVRRVTVSVTAGLAEKRAPFKAQTDVELRNYCS